MGGVTITKVADNMEQLLDVMKKQILGAANAGLWADSALVVIEPGAEEAKIFEIKYEGDDGDVSVEFKAVEKGRIFHVGVAARYGEKPGLNQLVGTAHVHT